jgi:hypothetical protein
MLGDAVGCVRRPQRLPIYEARIDRAEPLVQSLVEQHLVEAGREIISHGQESASIAGQAAGKWWQCGRRSPE